MYFVWPERVILIWAALLFCVLVLAGISDPAHAIGQIFTADFFKLCLILIGVPWFFLRFVDLCLGGPGRRSWARPISPSWCERKAAEARKQLDEWGFREAALRKQRWDSEAAARTQQRESEKATLIPPKEEPFVWPK